LLLELLERIVSSRMERMTTPNSPDGQPKTFEKTVFHESLHRIFRTGWIKATALWEPGGNNLLVQLHEKNGEVLHVCFRIIPRRSLIIPAIRIPGTSLKVLYWEITASTEIPWGHCHFLNTSLDKRRNLFLSTEFPQRFPVMIAIRETPCS